MEVCQMYKSFLKYQKFFILSILDKKKIIFLRKKKKNKI